jgi:thymidylate synthase
MVAQCVGLKAGELLHTISDAHVYENHVEPLKEMLFRPIFKEVKPQIMITNPTTNFYELKPEDIKLIGYNSHPHIKMEVAV